MICCKLAQTYHYFRNPAKRYASCQSFVPEGKTPAINPNMEITMQFLWVSFHSSFQICKPSIFYKLHSQLILEGHLKTFTSERVLRISKLFVNCIKLYLLLFSWIKIIWRRRILRHTVYSVYTVYRIKIVNQLHTSNLSRNSFNHTSSSGLS